MALASDAFGTRSLRLVHRGRELLPGTEVSLPQAKPTLDVMLSRSSFTPRLRNACETLEYEISLLDQKIKSAPVEERTELRRSRRYAQEQLEELRRIMPRRATAHVPAKPS